MVLLDGTLVRTRRRTKAANRKNYSGKHKAHGLLFLALTDEKGNLICISSTRPGRASEITAARHDHITRHLREAGLGALADLGFVGPDDDPDDAPVIITGRKATRSDRLTDAEKEANRLVSRGTRRRARLREPEDRAHPDQGPPERPSRHQVAASPARPGELRNPAVTDGHPTAITPPASTRTAAGAHTSTATCEFKMERSHWGNRGGVVSYRTPEMKQDGSDAGRTLAEVPAAAPGEHRGTRRGREHGGPVRVGVRAAASDAGSVSLKQRSGKR
ncbi:transposase family protein [Streptomyces ficellus]|uniref:Transposase family protein n=1 Tax=Streptomyces ficellus TaxID=1977088 RepID=A0ABT7Z1N3_9ACTN|nr:transposase family protein [Streptomyces ficellus]MDN3293400.1 transposase family protein [Streptomyces ficellus]